MVTIKDAAPLPGGVGVSRLHVYDTPAPDGLISGSAHVHLTCTEGYVVVGGEGAVQTLSAAGYRETPLRTGTVVWFTPGTIHRLVNGDGHLEILTIMQNGGLPEAGDAVLTFPADVLADEDRYRSAHGLGGPDPAGAARERRDLAITGFHALRERVEREGTDALRDFYTAALRIVGGKVPTWRTLWEDNALRAARATGEQLDALERGDLDYLLAADVHSLASPSEEGRFGMCGTLDTYLRTQAG